MTWMEQNRAFLASEIERVKQRCAGVSDAAETTFAHAPPALVVLQRMFGLSAFERDVVLFCAGAALDPASFATPTFGQALAMFADPHLDATTPDAPLRAHRLVHIGLGGTLAAPLSLDERVLYFLLGIDTVDERILPLRITTKPASAHGATVKRLTTILETAQRQPLALQVSGGSPDTRIASVCAAADRSELRALRLRASMLPTSPSEMCAFVAVCEREYLLARALVCVELNAHDSAETARTACAFVDQLRCVTAVIAAEPLALSRPSLHLEVPWPTSTERHGLWVAALGGDVARLGEMLERIAGQFRFDGATIDAALATCDRRADTETLQRDVWSACIERSRLQIDDLAMRIVPRMTWEDLVLPDRVVEMLREIGRHLRHRTKLNETWGFARESRGHAITALFAGPSGTGKTLAAEVIARDAGLDLYHVDLSQVVDKYVGETEKRLRRIFDAAEQGGAILLFDEADALFGKRAQIERGTDRWANLEVSYLLQRMERYRGLAILTTNAKDAIDTAFLRRLRFVVRFPFPDPSLRGSLWRRAFPPEAPTAALDIDLLARLQLTGANIKTVAFASAVHAAAEATPVTMEHVIRAARSEFAKLEVPFPEAELAARISAMRI